MGNKLVDLSLEFSAAAVSFCDTLKVHSSLVNQMERSATSIGANIHEANYAQSRADFIAKLQIALKECYETEYWLKLFQRTGIGNDEKLLSLQEYCGTLRRLLISSLNTAKGKKS